MRFSHDVVDDIHAALDALEKSRPAANPASNGPPDCPYGHTASITNTVPEGCERLQVHVWYRHGEKYYGKVRNNKCWPKGGYPIEEPPPGVGGEGDLSEQGRARMRNFGNQLRSALIARDGFLNSDTAKDDEVFLWVCKHASQKDDPESTTNQRHWESLREVCRGMWPEDTRQMEDLNLQGPTDSVERYTAHHDLTATQKERMANMTAAWDAHYAALSFPVCEREAVAPLIQEQIDAGRKEPVHDLQMRMMCSAVHGEPLPPGVTVDDYRDLAQADAMGWSLGNRHNESEFGRLSMGRVVCAMTDALARAAGNAPLLANMCSHMGSQGAWAVPDVPPPKLFLWSATDGHLGPLAATLKIPYPVFARFGAFVMFELFRRRSDGKVLLRVTQDSKVLTSFVQISADSAGLFSWPHCFDMLKRLCRD